MGNIHTCKVSFYTFDLNSLYPEMHLLVLTMLTRDAKCTAKSDSRDACLIMYDLTDFGISRRTNKPSDAQYLWDSHLGRRQVHSWVPSLSHLLDDSPVSSTSDYNIKFTRSIWCTRYCRPLACCRVSFNFQIPICYGVDWWVLSLICIVQIARLKRCSLGSTARQLIIAHRAAARHATLLPSWPL